MRFSSADQKDRALEIIRNTNLGGQASQDLPIGIKFPQPVVGPSPAKKLKLSDSDNTDAVEPARTIADVINAWHAVPYEEQLSRKQKEMADIMQQIVSKTAKDNFYAPLPAWLESARRRTPRHACTVESIIPSPHTDGYRNKIELSAGRDPVGRACFGFLVGAVSDGHVAVVSPDSQCRIISEPQRQFVMHLLNPLLSEGISLYGLQVRREFRS